MNRITPITSTLLLSATLLSCGQHHSITSTLSAPSANEQSIAPAGARSDVAPSAPAPGSSPTSPQPPNPLPRSRPQLIRRAEMSVTIDSVDTARQQAETIVRRQGGDLLNLQQQQPDTPGSRREATLEFRVPQEYLDSTLAQFARLGTVERQTITAEDVSNQLVDFKARLANLRKTEQSLLKIMDRSGSVADVLQVAEKLATVRESIEQIDAQLANLQAQVAYSSIRLYLAEAKAIAVTAPPPANPLGAKVQESWEQSTRSLTELSASLLGLSIWLLVFSPFWLAITLIGFLLYRHWRSPHPTATEPTKIITHSFQDDVKAD